MSISITENPTYQTSDIALAATIASLLPLEAVDKANPHKAKFIFRRTDKLDQLVDQYWRRELRVEPQSYFNQLKAVKARLYSEE